jgi:hypothetical protein
MNTSKEKFNYIAGLPDFIIIKGLCLLFKQYNTDGKLDSAVSLMKEDYVTVSVTVNNIIECKVDPKVGIRTLTTFIILHDELVSLIVPNFMPEFIEKDNEFKRFELFYNICTGLYRKETLNHILG